MLTQKRTFIPGSSKVFVLAGMWFVLALIGQSRVALATTDPNPGIPDEVQNPFSERCQRAFNTYYREAEWFMNHNTLPIDDPRFVFHYDRLFDSWYIAELECGLDIDNNGVLG